MRNFILQGIDAKELVIYEWSDIKRKTPKGIIQFVHGFSDWMERYSELANFMNQNGYIFIGSDLRGHGKTNEKPDDEGLFANRYGDKLLVQDQWVINRYIKMTWEDVPIIMIGHSLGSLIARNFSIQHGDLIDKLVLNGMMDKIGLDIKILTYLSLMIGRANKQAKFISKLVIKKVNDNLINEIDVDVNQSWRNKDEQLIEQVSKYNLQENYLKTSAYHDIIKLIKNMKKNKHINYSRSSLEILMTCGSEDPITNFAKEPFEYYQLMKNKGFKIRMQTYFGLRHEVFLENERKDVYNEILNFIER